MASNRRSNNKTKYTFKGTKNVENKYANIFDDLNKKEESYMSNSLRQIHKDEEGEKFESKVVIREVSIEEAEENARKRKQRLRNERALALEKSNPVIEKTDDFEIDRLEKIEMLKREKRANDPDYVHKKAMERVNMDKTDVKIYKEYSDFERAVPLGRNTGIKNDISNNSGVNINSRPSDTERIEKTRADLEDDLNDNISRDTRVIDNLKNLSYKSDDIGILEDLKGRTSDISRFELDEDMGTRTSRNTLTHQEIISRESEIEELIKRMRENEDSEDRKARRKRRKEKVKDADLVEDFEDFSALDTNSLRSSVYRKSNEKNTKKINFKRVGLVAIILVISAIVIASGIDLYRTTMRNGNTSVKQDQSSTSTKNTAEKNNSTDKTENKESKEAKISKLEAAKSKLNSNEAERLQYIIDNYDSYPQDLIDLVIRNSETVDYVYSYKDREKYNAKKLTTNITSSYYVDGDVPLFLQWDRRWGYRNYGSEMMGLAGCGPTSLAMVIRYFDKNSTVNPYDIAQYSEKNGYLSKDNSTSWSLFEKGLSNYGLKSVDVVPVEARMKKALDDGKILVASVKPGIFTSRGHILVIKGYNSKGDFLINDPNSIVNTNKTWTYDELKNEIRKIWGVDSTSRGSSSSSNKSTNTSSSSDSTSGGSGSSDDPSLIQDIE